MNISTEKSSPLPNIQTLTRPLSLLIIIPNPTHHVNKITIFYILSAQYLPFCSMRLAIFHAKFPQYAIRRGIMSAEGHRHYTVRNASPLKRQPAFDAQLYQRCAYGIMSAEGHRHYTVRNASPLKWQPAFDAQLYQRCAYGIVSAERL